MAGKREVGIVSSLLWACAWLCFESVASADDEKGGGFELPCDYAITTILPPSGFGTQLLLQDMNDSGVAVGSYRVNITYHACIWSKEGGIQPLPEPWWVSESYGHRINNNGWILVNGSGQKTRGYVLIPNGGGGYDTAEIEPASASGWSSVFGINDKNEVVGVQSMGMQGDPVNPFGGFRWSDTAGKQDILAPGFVSTQCNDINDDGVVCGNASMTLQPTMLHPSIRGFVLADGLTTVIQPEAPYVKTEALRINACGAVVGTMRTHVSGSPTDYEGYVKEIDSDAPVLIPTPQGTWGWRPVDIRDDGTIGGSVNLIPDSTGRYPVLCREGAFTNLAPPLGLTMGSPAFSSFGPMGAVLVFGCNSCGGMTLGEPKSLDADLDCDGIVGSADLAIVIREWGSPSSQADISQDGAVDGSDLGIVLGQWTE